MSTPSDISITGYYQLSQLYTSSKTLVYRGLRASDDKAVVIKMLRQNYPTPVEISRYQQEYDIIQTLAGEGVIKTYGLERYQNTVFLVLEDFGGESLRSLMTKTSLSILEGLEVAIATTIGLQTLHQGHIIHKDITPANIVLNPTTQQLKIIDFGISTALPETASRSTRPERLEGTLAYLAPEQTGRMSRLMDYRADFYSLGATLYELFTGQRPFADRNLLALVHAHLAKPVKPPHQINPDLPKMVSEILLKLLAKNAEDRYQSILGLQTDLIHCRDQIAQTGQIQTFSLAEQDQAEQLQISKQLYGRQIEITLLETAVEQLMQPQPRPQTVIISGAAGLGKTALIQELFKPLTQHGGYIISGKFDQLQRGTPYSAILQAFRTLIEQLLTLESTALNQWRTKLENALKENLGVMVEILPELTLIVGAEVPAAPSLEPKEAQNRLHWVIRQFVSVFTQSAAPLVIVLDDLHWSDAESLDLLEYLIDFQSPDRLMLIGAYRDEAIHSLHPLTRTLDNLRQTGIGVTSLALTPLDEPAVQALLADTLRLSPATVADLAEIIIAKTEGNPFFINEFIKSLSTDQLLWFDPQAGIWSWHLNQIRQRSITNNVVQLLTNRLHRLDPSVQTLLQLAACLGSRFTLDRLTAIAQTGRLKVAQRMHRAVVVGLVQPLDQDYRVQPTQPTLLPDLAYQFTHDRIQQVAYALMPDPQRPNVHWQIGQQLWSQVSSSEKENTIGRTKQQQLFEIVNHFNLGAESEQATTLTHHEKKDWRWLNLLAGRQARQSAAFATALTYLTLAVNLLQPQDWENDYAATLAIYQEAAEAAYASRDYDGLENLTQIIFANTTQILDNIRPYSLLIQARIGENRLIEAIQLGLSVLHQLDIHLPEEPTMADIETALATVQTLLADREIASLVELPRMTDPKQLAAMQILEAIFPSSYFAKPMLMPLVTFEQVRLALSYGNMKQSPLAYVFYGSLLCNQFGQLDDGYAFGELALAVVAQIAAPKSIQARVLQGTIGFVKHFKEPYHKNYAQLLEAYQLGLDSGDVEIAGHSVSMYAIQAYLVGMPLPQLDQELTAHRKTLKLLKQSADLDFVRAYHQKILNLMGRSPDRCRLTGDVYDEETMLPRHQETGNRSAIVLAYFEKSLLCYTFQSFDRALEYSEVTKSYLDAVTGAPNVPLFYYYDSLIRLAACTTAPDQVPLLEQVEQNQQRLKQWATHAPDNYLPWVTLIDAEQQRVLNNTLAAMDRYERAITLAQEKGVVQDEALANELAGQFHFSQQRLRVADTYLLNARYGYLRWGATAKVQELDERYPHLAAKVGKTKKGRSSTTTTATDGVPIIDVATLLKSAQILAAEIVPEQLLAKLMRIVLENAGAQHGVLMLPRGENWWIEAESWSDEISVQSQPLKESADQPPKVPLGVINYVIRTQTSIVLDSAYNAEQFAQDSYIQTNQTQSLLCLPLLNQGQLDGLLYLENNLAQGVFDETRVETLKVLSTQAAISIENAQLYQRLETYNKTLEQRVTARTQELSQTLEVLKATQAELVIENALLRSDTEAETYSYQVGGSLPMDAPTYVVRQADRQLYQALQKGDYCHILNARQMGKSSLRIQMTRRLQAEDIVCATVDLSVIGNHQTSQEQWYTGLTYALASSLNLLSQFNLRQWRQENDFLPPVQRLGAFIDQIVLPHIPGKIVLFIDEIDSVFSLEFAADDFFVWLRACFNQRADQPDYHRLTIVLLGVATPQQLIQDGQRTPFNIGQSIVLKGFALHEAQPLLYGLAEQVTNPQAVLAQILSWTGGQPFLSQKICQMIRQLGTTINEGEEIETVNQLVQSHILAHWETQDDPQHLRTIRDRILSQSHQTGAILQCYHKILQGESVRIDNSPEQQELLLSGLVIKQSGQLTVANRIYANLFNQNWITAVERD